MILGADHKPLPPSDIVERLRQVDPALGLKFCPGCFWDEKTDRMVDSWAITEAWAMDDPRRKLVWAGELPPDECADVVVFLPADCPVDQAYGYLVRKLKRNTDTGQEHARKLLERVHTFNANRQREIMAPVMADAEELIEANAGTLFRDQGKTSTKVHAMTHAKVETQATRDRKLREYLDQ